MLHLSLGFRALGKLLSTKQIFVISCFSESKLRPRIPWDCVPDEHWTIFLSPVWGFSPAIWPAVIFPQSAVIFPQSGMDAGPVLIMNSLGAEMIQDEQTAGLRFSWRWMCWSLWCLRGPCSKREVIRDPRWEYLHGGIWPSFLPLLPPELRVYCLSYNLPAHHRKGSKMTLRVLV